MSPSRDLPIPFAPEEIESLRARYLAALAVPCEVETSGRAITFRPGEARRCVFDCEDGIRLVISRDLFEGQELLHVSGSAVEGSRFWHMIRDGLLGPEAFFGMIEERFREISGDAAPLEFHGLSPAQGIPHWFREMKGAAR